MESHRRPGRLLRQDLPLPPEPRIHLHDAPRVPRAAAVRLCRLLLVVPPEMRRLSGAFQVSSRVGMVPRKQFTNEEFF